MERDLGSPISTANLDGANDSPAQARQQLFEMAGILNRMISMAGGSVLSSGYLEISNTDLNTNSEINKNLFGVIGANVANSPVGNVLAHFIGLTNFSGTSQLQVVFEYAGNIYFRLRSTSAPWSSSPWRTVYAGQDRSHGRVINSAWITGGVFGTYTPAYASGGMALGASGVAQVPRAGLYSLSASVVMTGVGRSFSVRFRHTTSGGTPVDSYSATPISSLAGQSFATAVQALTLSAQVKADAGDRFYVETSGGTSESGATAQIRCTDFMIGEH